MLGLILPALFCVVYIENFHLWSTFQAFGMLLKETFSRLLYLSVFPNLALIFVFYTLDAWRLSKGVLIGAFPYIIASVILTI